MPDEPGATETNAGQGHSPTRQHTDTPTRPLLLERIIEASARNPFLVLILTIFGILGWVWTQVLTPLDAIPNLTAIPLTFFTDWLCLRTHLLENPLTPTISTPSIPA